MVSVYHTSLIVTSTIMIWLNIVSTTYSLYSYICPLPKPCLCERNRIHCANASLTEFPKFQKKNVTFNGWIIDFSYNNIKRIPSKAFLNVTVYQLGMSHNNIISIADDAFHGSENIINWLFLQNNNLNHVPEAIGKLSYLISLSIQYNPIQTISDAIMRNLSKSLQFLDIGSEEMMVWPRPIGHLKAVEFPTFYNLPMSDLPDNAFHGLEDAAIILLEFKSAKLVRLPKALGVLRNTTGLVLTNNTEILSSNINQDSLRGMAALHTISVDNCSWTEVPDFSEVQSLTSLELTNCPIFRWETNKTDSYLSLNRLILDKTDITKIPVIISQMKNLTNLSFFGTKITEITKDNFAGLTKLAVLTMSFSPVRTISPDAFEDNKAMVYLTLDNMRLKAFPRAIKSLPSMKFLDLNNNTIDCSCASMGFMKGWSGIGGTFVGGECNNKKMQINEFLRNEVNKC